MRERIVGERGGGGKRREEEGQDGLKKGGNIHLYFDMVEEKVCNPRVHG